MTTPHAHKVMEIPLHQAVVLKTFSGQELGAKLIDADADHVAIKLDDPWTGAMPTGTVLLHFTANHFYWKAPVAVADAFNGWWFLSRPEAGGCERIQRRTFVRIAFESAAVAMPTTPAGEPTGELVTLGLTNLSAEGCLAVSTDELLLDDRLSIYLTLPEVPTTHVTGRIVRKFRRDADWEYGIRFEGLTDAFHAQIVAFIESEIAQHQAMGLDITSPGG